MKIGKITIDPANIITMENIELAPAELPDVEKLIDKFKELQIASMQATQQRRTFPPPRVSAPKTCDVDGCNEMATWQESPKLATGSKISDIWLCDYHHNMFPPFAVIINGKEK